MNKDKLKVMLLRHEGYNQMPYKCSAGKLTIGVGRNLTDKGLSMDEVEILFENDLSEVLKELNKLDWFCRLDETRQMPIADMAFQMGVSGLLKFRKMIGHLERGWFEKAAKEVLNSKYARQTPIRAEEISEMLTRWGDQYEETQ
ncbi:MAG: glycoside hydrolase family protein [Halobacteria archaeon]|nr:glycoside hydrolase family protein [Halobacteria archaeon]